jgi:hypothetical protein
MDKPRLVLIFLILRAGGFDARYIESRLIRKRRAIASIESTKGNALIADFERAAMVSAPCSGLHIEYIG